MMVFSQGEKLLFKFKSPYLMMCQLIEEKIASLKHFVLFFFFSQHFWGPGKIFSLCLCLLSGLLCLFVSLLFLFVCLFVVVVVCMCVCVCVCVLCL